VQVYNTQVFNTGTNNFQYPILHIALLTRYRNNESDVLNG